VIVVCTSAAKNWAGLVTTRVLLGVFESAVAPSLMLITTMWYKVGTRRKLDQEHVPTSITALRTALASRPLVHRRRRRNHHRLVDEFRLPALRERRLHKLADPVSGSRPDHHQRWSSRAMVPPGQSDALHLSFPRRENLDNRTPASKSNRN